MNLTRRGFIALGLSWLAAARGEAHEWAHAHHPDPEEIALGSLADAELAFATTASHQGRRAALFANAAPDAVLLEERVAALRDLGHSGGPGPRHQSQPAQIGLARSHDFGYASGPFRSDDASGASVHGVFMRLWRRQASAPWRIVLTAKVNTPRAVDFVPLGAAPRPSFAGKADAQKGHAEIAHLEARLRRASRPGASIAPWLAQDVRWYREGAMPLAGRPAISRIVEAARHDRNAAPAAIHVARTADLAVAFGRSHSVPQASWYLHVWLRRRDGTWRLAHDMASSRGRE